MLDLAKGAGLFLVLTLAGCATKPVDRDSLNWSKDEEDPEFASTFPQTNPGPVFGSAPLSAPALPAAPPFRTDADLDAPQETWVSLKQWCAIKGLEAPSSAVLRGNPAVALQSAHGTLTVQPGSQIVDWNGIQIQLGFVPQWEKEDLRLHSLDLGKTLQPLLLAAPRPPPRSPVVVIDPGHGGEDSGALSVVGQGREKDFALDWARRLQNLLVASGWKAFLTHTADRTMSLANRVAFADHQKADFFVSLHFNSASTGNHQAGLETYCLTPAGMPSNLTRESGDDPGLTFANNDWDGENVVLAARVHRALLATAAMPDRGVRRARFMGVLRGQQRPAILVEGGFLSNPAEAQKIADPAYRQRLAEGVAWGLLGRSPLGGDRTAAMPPSAPGVRP